MANNLDDNARASIVYRLLYGETIIECNDKIYKVINPSPKIRVLANSLYDKTIYENRFGSWLKDRECIAILARQGLCSPMVDQNLEEIDKNIDNLKAELYQSMFRTETMKKVRKTLDLTKRKREEMNAIRHMLDYTTLSGYAEMVRRQFILFHTLYYFESGDKVFDSWDNIDISILEDTLSENLKSMISTSNLREVARTEPWRGIWSSTEHRPFGSLPGGERSDEQRAIVLFSQMYDSVSKHPECPPEDVVEDDDLFDGWLIIQRRKREKDQMDKQMDTRLKGRHSGAEEVYVLAQGEDKESIRQDINNINSMNTTHGKIVKAQREKQLKARGKMTDAEFLDRRLQIQQESNESFIQQVKGKK